jgi:CHAT domain-containing protein
LQPHDDLPAVRRLIVLPAGWLAGIPVEGLTDEYAVSYAPSATLYARLGERPRTAAPALLAVGDPVFTRPGGAEAYPSLPGTRREVLALAGLFPEATTLLGSEASRQRLDRLARDGGLRAFGYLHLATHGEPDERHALRSALVLAQDQLPDALEQARSGGLVDDGRLTAEQVLRSWELNAELVTLSACRSGLGRYGGGEGYLGFSQALFLVGARSCVLSLWHVDDTATALLMTRFYENLLGKRDGRAGSVSDRKSKVEALREAKQWLRTLSGGQVTEQVARLPRLERGGIRAGPPAAADEARPFAHPHYWSAFILIGDPE